MENIEPKRMDIEHEEEIPMLETLMNLMNNPFSALRKCPYCNSYAQSLVDNADICNVCGGIGFLKKK